GLDQVLDGLHRHHVPGRLLDGTDRSVDQLWADPVLLLHRMVGFLYGSADLLRVIYGDPAVPFLYVHGHFLPIQCLSIISAGGGQCKERSSVLFVRSIALAMR